TTMWFPENPRIRLIPLPSPPDVIRFSFLPTKFGRMLMGTVPSGKALAICSLYFVDKSDDETFREIQQRWPKSRLLRDDEAVEKVASMLFNPENKENALEVPIAVQGTELQQAVWTALAGLQNGETCTYSQLAERVDRPKAVRAVANAVAKNEVAILVPCHRIVSKDGSTKYHWGAGLKQQLLEFEKSIK
ncbi:hypothetical protein KR018_001617, partial [Drosophila ironensis]